MVDAPERLRHQLGDLKQTLASSTAKTLSRADAIESEVRGLSESLQRLASELTDLRNIVRNLNPDEPDRWLQRTTTEVDRRTMQDDVGALKMAGGVMQERLLRLEQRRAALQESLSGLSLQQVRTEQGTRRLQRQVRQLSFLVAVVLLAAGTLTWLAHRV